MHESYFAADKKKNDHQVQYAFREHIMPLPKYIPRADLEAELSEERLTQEVLAMIKNPSLLYAASLMVEHALYKSMELRSCQKVLSIINFSYHQELVIGHNCIKQLRAYLKKNKHELLVQGGIFIDDAHERIHQNEQTLLFIDELEAVIDDDVVAQEYVEISLTADHVQDLSDNDSLNAPLTIEDFVILENYFE